MHRRATVGDTNGHGRATTGHLVIIITGVDLVGVVAGHQGASVGLLQIGERREVEWRRRGLGFAFAFVEWQDHIRVREGRGWGD